ncbi:hypothetical protein [Streptomyces sp. NPDC053755]|uniref:hypothetical protein n=1 Tax=Streptomyces sp. NPDC053755 TaxID=3155815 RepID=UPI003441AE47
MELGEARGYSTLTRAPDAHSYPQLPALRQPVTIVALLATPEAARPTIPTASPDVIPMRRS